MIQPLLAATLRNARAVLADRRGVTAAEYAVLATGIVLVVGIAAKSLGTKLSGIFASIGS